MTAHGVDGQVELVGDVIRLSRSGLNALFSQGVKEIFIDDISSIQLKEAGFMRGYIQFAFRGGLEAKGGVFEAAADENTVLFTKDQQPAFLQMKAAIDQRRGELRRPAAQVGTAVEPPDDLVAQLERLTALHTSGALSDADFDAAKRKVLGT